MKIKNYYISAILLISAATMMIGCQRGEASFNKEAIATVRDLPDGHKKFIAEFYPNVVEANKAIMLNRAELINLRDDYYHVIRLKRKLDKVNNLAAEYRFGDNFFDESLSREEYVKRIDTLLFRVDYIPEKLVMAQAIIESGWGGSKFSKEINNYFGIHCYTPGCGRPPSSVENPSFWVKSFPTIESCIEEYLWLLNTGYAYRGLRLTRQELRSTKQYPDAILLAEGLKKYSEKGTEYIDLVESIINNYLPQNLDEFVKYVNSGEPELS